MADIERNHADVLYKETTRANIETCYNQFATAMKQKNLSDLLGLLNKDFTWQLLDGEKLNRDQTATALKEFFDQSRIVEMGIRIIAMRFGEIGVEVMATEQTVSSPLDIGSSAGTSETVEDVEESWVSDGERWNLLSSRVTRSVTVPFSAK